MPGGGSSTAGHMVTPEPSHAGRRAWCNRTSGDAEALPHQELGYGAAGHVATPEPSCARRRVWHHGTRGDARALPCREVGSCATGHVATPEPSLAGRWGLALWDVTYVLCIGVPGLQGTYSGP
jgi:hypothetical protein